MRKRSTGCFLRSHGAAGRGDAQEEETLLAISMFERAIEIDPNFAQAYAELSMAHSWMYQEAPYHSADRLTEAKRAVDRTFELQPNLPEAHIALGFYHYRIFKNYHQALQEFSIVQKTIPNDKLLLMGLASIHKRQGNFKAALRKDAISGPEFVRNLAIVYATLGEYEAAMDQIDYLLSIQLAPHVGISVPMLRIDPTWDPLRDHPRFQQLLQKYS